MDHPDPTLVTCSSARRPAATSGRSGISRWTTQRSDRTGVGGLDEVLEGSLAGHESIVAEDSTLGCAAPDHYPGPAASDLTYTLDR